MSKDLLFSFICVIMSCNNLKLCVNILKARGKVRMEGKDYIMQDGDVVEFRFNV